MDAGGLEGTVLLVEDEPYRTRKRPPATDIECIAGLRRRLDAGRTFRPTSPGSNTTVRQRGKRWLFGRTFATGSWNRQGPFLCHGKRPTLHIEKDRPSVSQRLPPLLGCFCTSLRTRSLIFRNGLIQRRDFDAFPPGDAHQDILRGSGGFPV